MLITIFPFLILNQTMIKGTKNAGNNNFWTLQCVTEPPTVILLQLTIANCCNDKKIELMTTVTQMSVESIFQSILLYSQ